MKVIFQEYDQEANNPGRNEIVAIHYFHKNTTGEGALEDNLSALAATPEKHAASAERFQDLAGSYYNKYERTRDLEDLMIVIDYGLSALAETPDGHPDMAGRLQSLAIYYTSGYTHTGDPEVLEAALAYNLKAVAGTPLGHPELARRHQSLATAHLHRYRRAGNFGDLETALRFNLSATIATPEDHPDLAERHQSLAVSYTDRYKRTGKLEDMTAALKYDLLAVAATAEDDPDLGARHQSLGISYLDRFKRTGALKDLEAAIQYSLSGLAATSERDPNLAGRHQKVAMTYNLRYRQNGNLRDLEAAIEHNTLAIAAAPHGQSDLAALTSQSLAVSYMDRFQRTGDLEDMQNAISYNILSVTATPEGHPDLPARYRNVSVSHLDRYTRGADLEDLEAALKYSSLAVAKTPEGHPDLAGRYQNLGGIYYTKYIREKTPKDLWAAFMYILLAVDTTPEADPEYALRQNCLAMCYEERYKRIRESADIEAALVCHLAAVAATPDDHPGLASMQVNLARSYLFRYAKTTDTKDLDMANNLFKSALKSTIASPKDIWNISVQFSEFQGVFPLLDILEGYKIALNTLPSFLWLGSSLHNRHDSLVRNDVSNFIATAVTFALQASKPKLALEFLEQGLSTTHKQSLQLRSEHTKLQGSLPIIAQRMQHISAQLQSSLHPSDSGINYHLLAHERQELIQEIRTHTGFEDFLLPPKYANLCTASVHGPVIMLNCSNLQTDAIIIISPSVPPIHLCLPDAPAPAIEEHLGKLKIALKYFSIHSRNSRYGKPSGIGNDSSKNLLDLVITWIWETIVKPVFDALKDKGINNGRLWWCPSGLFTYLPLHAAAPLESNFIQSYTPTLDTLINANTKSKPSVGIDDLAVVGLVEASASLGAWSNLPAVEEELIIVAAFFKNQAHQLKDSQATIENVMKGIELSPWVHLACHGQQDLAEPLKSGLILYDGKLELEQILHINLPNAKFAYLSACETAMGDSKLVNEAMHLAGGFLAAGYQGAIGTLWSMPDIYGPKVAEVVYKTIFGEDNIPDASRAAEGLHLAIQKLRRDGVHLHQWMPFIHLGI
ncbi:CHAT domain-containing protein [Collybia nuda]|uniref:CHAT domain-containing protein n=1 Tax=Collybia nuda TaxID=64659 RepID=A0A9P6CM41_9AGAR|nr:CHAT domain-containing protein [Collybia nuda]